ncbi:MAG: dihydrolipoamide acetyltransferase family protein [Candidatus Methylomirabilia bacterium]
MAITRVVMPKLSEAMETGKVIKWLKQEGERVEGGEILAEIETDKADIELESFGAGILRRILVPGGQQVPVGGLIAVIAEPEEDLSQVLAEAQAAAPAAAPAPVEVSPGAPRGREAPEPVTLSLAPAAVAEAATAAEAPGLAAAGRIKASPLARKIAEQAAVDLTLVQGSGPGGRIIRRDVEAVAAESGGRRGVTPVPAAPETPYEDRPLSSIRAAIARRMAQAKGPVPHFYLTTEVAMDRAWDLREELNALEGQPKVSVTDMVVKACALALGRHPGVNASFQGETIRAHYRVHIGIAVALEEGLITPVLRECDRKSLVQIAVEGKDLAERARNRRLRSHELSGATFSVSNLGMFDVEEFSAIINPPEGAILAVGSVARKPVIEGDRLGIGRRMRLTLSCDHRVMDGAMAARFLQDLRRLMEEPLRLLVS